MSTKAAKKTKAKSQADSPVGNGAAVEPMADGDASKSDVLAAEPAAGAASAMPLFYSKPIALDVAQHSKLGLIETMDLGFTKTANALPINLVEFTQACQHFPIAFAKDDTASPVAIVGLRDSENLALNADGTWNEGSYIPAYIRRYPFIFAQAPGGDRLSLCVDMVDGLVVEGGPRAFFTDDDKPTELTTNALEFCKSYHAAAQVTMAFSKAVAESGILVDRRADMSLDEDNRIRFTGFQVVDEEKLRNLPDETVLDWHKKGWLAAIQVHLMSMNRWTDLLARLKSRMA